MVLEIIDRSFDSPDENLRFEETLLESCDTHPNSLSTQGGTLRFWESSSYFVVLGASNKPEVECHVDACNADGIPILKRCSGGGTVLQGPGCLNYAFILPIDAHPKLKDVQSTNCFIMSLVRDAIQPALSEPVEIKGHTDLAIHGIKFSGNAQRRKRRALLFHGTLLYNFDLTLIATYLDTPSKQPDYRQGRSHLDFVQNLSLDRDTLVEHLSQSVHIF